VLRRRLAGAVLVLAHLLGDLAELLDREVTGAGHGVDGLVLAKIVGQRHPTSSFPSCSDCVRCAACFADRCADLFADMFGMARSGPSDPFEAGPAVLSPAVLSPAALPPVAFPSGRPSSGRPSWGSSRPPPVRSAGNTPASSFSLRNEA